MPEFKYNDFQKSLEKSENDGFASVYLIYGEEYLYKKAFQTLLDKMLPGSEKSLGYEPVDANETMPEVLERINTFSFMGGVKVVAVQESRVFHSKQDDSSIISKAKEAFNGDKLRKAAGYFVSLMSLHSLAYEDLDKDALKKVFKADDNGGTGWMEDLRGFCVENKIKIPLPTDDAKLLQDAVEKGFPKNNHLIITTDVADKRRTLYKAIKKEGIIIDCSVPKGERKADKSAQESVLRESMNSILGKAGKEMAGDAYKKMCEMTGFDLRTFAGNLEKLVSYTGDRKKITVKDVDDVLKRTKQDPIYELTGAIADRNLSSAMFYTGSLLSAGLYPLQIMAAITNQVRKLLIVKDFTTSRAGGCWRKGMQYNQFTSSVMPHIEAYDNNIKDLVSSWDDLLSTGKKGKKKKSATDLVIAKNPKSAYPVFLLLAKSENYSIDELINAMDILSAADTSLKTSGKNPRLIIEEAIMKICGKSRYQE